MSGTLLLIGEILLFMVAATLIGFLVGRLSRRARPQANVSELREMRERNSLLARDVDELTAALTDARNAAARGADAGDLQAKLAMSEREAEALERKLQEASARIEELQQMEAAALETQPDDSGADDENVEALREELERRTEELARLERVAADAARFEEELAARNDRIGRLEAALEAKAAANVAGDPGAASIGISTGAGNYADSRLEFEAWDAND